MIGVMAYVLYESIDSDRRPVGIAVAMVAAGYLYYYAYLHPRRGHRWTMPDPVRDATDPAMR
ncbi:hypothetical protein ACIRL2_38185 [Embleya sp. NPDC127516]|uniref:hypothetical protein n=1 Tax=Embleya sp. NPDC127516 TaxID=3363990 RepID=UPI00380A67AB